MLSELSGRISGSVYAGLLAEGIGHDDILMAVEFQERQRKAGVAVYPLRVICGLDDYVPRAPTQFSQTYALIAPLASVKVKRARSKGGLHTTGRPIRAGSVRTGDPKEAEFVRPLSSTERKRLRSFAYKALETAKALAKSFRDGRDLDDTEQCLLSFTRSCRDVLLALLDEEEFRKGWCYPSYERLEALTSASRRTVHRALMILKGLGVVEWINRYVYTVSKQTGAHSEMTSNLYRFNVPARLAKLLGLHVPKPDDASWHEESAIEDHATMLAQTPPAQRRHLMPTDIKGRLALTLAALRVDLGRQLSSASRECQNSTPPHPIFNKKEKSGIGLVGRCSSPDRHLKINSPWKSNPSVNRNLEPSASPPDCSQMEQAEITVHTNER